MSLPFKAYTDQADESAYLREATEVSPELLKEEFCRVPADLAYWGERFALASGEFLRAEQRRRTTYARVRIVTREASLLAGTKLTEGDLDARVELDPAYEAAKLEEVEAEAAKLAAKARVDAVMAKKDMVISLGAHVRAEMGPDSIRRRE